MPIDYKHKTIFVHIPKTGGSSIERALNTVLEDQFYSITRAKNSNLPYSCNKLNSVQYEQCINKCPQHFTLNELKAILPETIYSNFYKFTIVRNPYDRLVSEYCFGKYIYNTFKAPNYNWPVFAKLVECLELPQLKRIVNFDAHLEPQYTFVNEDINDIFYFEKIQECFDKLKTKNIHILKSNNRKPYQEYYTKELQDKVYAFYLEDFIKFGYNYNM